MLDTKTVEHLHSTVDIWLAKQQHIIYSWKIILQKLEKDDMAEIEYLEKAAQEMRENQEEFLQSILYTKEELLNPRFDF